MAPKKKHRQTFFEFLQGRLLFCHKHRILLLFMKLIQCLRISWLRCWLFMCRRLLVLHVCLNTYDAILDPLRHLSQLCLLCRALVSQYLSRVIGEDQTSCLKDAISVAIFAISVCARCFSSERSFLATFSFSSARSNSLQEFSTATILASHDCCSAACSCRCLHTHSSRHSPLFNDTASHSFSFFSVLTRDSWVLCKFSFRYAFSAFL